MALDLSQENVHLCFVTEMNGFGRFSQREKKEEKGKDLLTWLSVGEKIVSKMKLNSAFAEHFSSQNLQQNTGFAKFS